MTARCLPAGHYCPRAHFLTREPWSQLSNFLSGTSEADQDQQSMVLYCRQSWKWAQKLSEVSLSIVWSSSSLWPWGICHQFIQNWSESKLWCIHSLHSIFFYSTFHPFHPFPFHSIPLYSSPFHSNVFHSNVLITYPNLVSKKDAVAATKMKMIRFCSQGALRLTKLHSIDNR